MPKGEKRCVLSITLLLTLIAATAVAIMGFAFRQLDESITVEGLQAAARNTDYILAQADDRYFEVRGTEDFSALFAFGQWQRQMQAPTGEPVLVLRFAEAWIVEFFSDGTAAAHNGYAASGTETDAYYSVPAQVSAELIAYLETHGVPREFGDGAIGMGTFHK